MRLVAVEQRQARALGREPFRNRETDPLAAPVTTTCFPSSDSRGRVYECRAQRGAFTSAATTNVAAATVSTASTTASTLCVS